MTRDLEEIFKHWLPLWFQNKFLSHYSPLFSDCSLSHVAFKLGESAWRNNSSGGRRVSLLSWHFLIHFWLCVLDISSIQCHAEIFCLLGVYLKTCALCSCSISKATVLHGASISDKDTVFCAVRSTLLESIPPCFIHWTQVQQLFLKSTNAFSCSFSKLCLLLWSSPPLFLPMPQASRCLWKHWHFRTEKLKEGGFLIAVLGVFLLSQSAS